MQSGWQQAETNLLKIWKEQMFITTNKEQNLFLPYLYFKVQMAYTWSAEIVLVDVICTWRDVSDMKINIWNLLHNDNHQ